jgi:hypothetical protein
MKGERKQVRQYHVCNTFLEHRLFLITNPCKSALSKVSLKGFSFAEVYKLASSYRKDGLQLLRMRQVLYMGQ